jgi:hypothetical protein
MRRLFVTIPSPTSRKFWEWSGVASRKILSSGMSAAANAAEA